VQVILVHGAQDIGIADQRGLPVVVEESVRYGDPVRSANDVELAVLVDGQKV
jgi:hypothetical protein